MSQSFVKRPDNGPLSALAGLGVLSTERAPSDPLDVLRRIVAWRDDVHAGRAVRSADLEALIQEARSVLLDTTRQQEVGSGWKMVPVEPTPEMCAAADEQGGYDNRRGTATVASNIYRAMLAAAPSTPEKAGGVSEQPKEMDHG